MLILINEKFSQTSQNSFSQNLNIYFQARKNDPNRNKMLIDTNKKNTCGKG